MISKWRGAAAALALLAIAAPQTVIGDDSISTAAPTAVDSEELKGLEDFVDGVMAQQIASHEVAGATIAVVHRGKVLFSRGYGFADIDAGEKVDPEEALFRPGSVSKLFTWTALMQQVEMGRVDLDEDVNRHIDFAIPPFEGQPILVRHLMSHSPGMSDVSGISVKTVEELTPYGEWIKTNIPERVWAPGTEIAYSNYGVALAGYIVERVSGEPFADYVENHIFEPLGMNSTTFREPLPDALAPRMAKGYELEEGRLMAQPFELYSSIMPAGSSTSSATDMARFMIAMLSEGRLDRARILKPESVRLLMSDSMANAPGLPSMAHGFYVIRDANPRLVGHGGNTGDFHSNLILAPESEFGFFVSVTGGHESSLGRTDLTNAIIGRIFPQPSAPRIAAPEGSTPPVGSYRANRLDYSRDPRPEYDIKVTAAGTHAIVVTRQEEVSYWDRIGPMIYERATGAREGGPYDRIRFYGDEDNLLMSYASQPYLAYRRVSAPEAAPADTPGTTLAGTSFTQPKDWSSTIEGPVTVFSAPEGDLEIAVVEIGAARDARDAAAKAWSLYDPDENRKVRLTTPAAPVNGWDERVNISYETSPAEQAVVSALSLRRDEAWTVLIVYGSQATANKRSAAVSLAQQALQPAGYERENFADKEAHRLTTERVQALRDFVAESARTLEVPGVALALIDQGEVVWQGGVGMRELGSRARVDAHTKFMIASNTKGMSTLLLSILADEDKLKWDQRVVDLYPSFRLGADSTTNATLVRHLVCACTGLPRKDWAFILADQGAPASDTFRQLAETQPTSDFGELFQYNNLMAAAAGYLAGALAYPEMELGAAYDKAMEDRIFGPLGMSDTTFDFDKGMRGNWARPHGLDINGQMTVMSNRFNYGPYPYRPAGGAFSSVADMARYVQLELSEGLTPDGERLVSEENLLERRTRGVQVSEDRWYGMGLFNEVDWGVPVVTHGGTLLGYHSNWFALPEANVGAVILTNADPGAAMLQPFVRRLLEVLYDGRPEAERAVAAAAARMRAQAAAQRQSLTVPGDPEVLDRLARRYESPGIGAITISNKDGVEWITAGSIEGPIATRLNPDGTVSLISIGPGQINVEALIGIEDGVRTLTVRDSQHEYRYAEVR
jgi:CubicO group peptidase (beta-lactamase class C family)